jgi:hypothetical protein
MGARACHSDDPHGQAVREPSCQGIATAVAADFGPQLLTCLGRIAVAIERLTDETRRLANHVAPAPGDIVGTPFLAKQLGCSVVWAGEMARDGRIPKHCIVPGTGNGKPWKFYREHVEQWLNKR